MENGGAVRAEFCSVPLSGNSGQVERVLTVRVDRGVTDASGSDPVMGQQLHAEVAALRADFRHRRGWESFISADESMSTPLQLADLLRNSESNFNICGESGTGRRHLAECIHVAGQNADSTCVPIECDLLSTEKLYDSLRELRRMANEHSAVHSRPGLLLLVGVDRLPREVQQWILEHMAEQGPVRIAGTSSVPLHQIVQQGWMLPEFRRLIAPVEIVLPRLHLRGKDVLLLAHEILQKNRRLLQTTPQELSAEVGTALSNYQWPGNVRELQQVIHDACEASCGDVIRIDELPFAFRAGVDAQLMAPATEPPVQSLDDILNGAERRILEATLKSCGNNKTEVARRLGLTRPSLYRRLRSLGLTDSVADD